MGFQITSLMTVYSTVYLGVDQRKHHSPMSLAFVRELSPVIGEFPAQRASKAKKFPFDDVIMYRLRLCSHTTPRADPGFEVRGGAQELEKKIEKKKKGWLIVNIFQA